LDRRISYDQSSKGSGLGVGPFSHRNFVTLIFPAGCLGCQRSIEGLNFDRPIESVEKGDSGFLEWQQSHFCDDCWDGLTDRHRPRCLFCGATIFGHNPFGNRCRLCHGTDLRFTKAIAIGNYQGLLQELIIRMKGQHDESLAIQLGRLLAYELIAQGMDDFDYVVSVPTFWLRRFKRGFHAADVICESVSQSTGIRIGSGILKAVRSTRKQGTLSNRGRFANVRNAFAVHKKVKLTGAKILVVDDVMTSGATASEISRVLLRHGAAEVHFGMIARGARGS
jgi:ComF family protein